MFGLSGLFLFVFLTVSSCSSPHPHRLGELRSLRDPSTITVTVVLSLRDLEGAEKMLQDVNTPGSDRFGKFLTPTQFYKLFGPLDGDVKKVKRYLTSNGLSVKQVTPLTIAVTGPSADIEAVFGVLLYVYEMRESDASEAYTYFAPSSPVSLPADVAPLVSSVVGLNTKRVVHQKPLVLENTTVSSSRKSRDAKERSGEEEGEEYLYNPVGEWTVTDFAHYYNVQPLYEEGIKGQGQTIGFISFAPPTLSEVFAYWTDVGITYDPNRVTVTQVNGGAGPSTPFDVLTSNAALEQAGGVAPLAKLILYETFKDEAGVLNAFAQAIDDNIVQSLATAWGEWEVDANGEVGQTLSPFVVSMHTLFVQAGLQGQSLFAASGDVGAYYINGFWGCYGPYLPAGTACSLTLSVAYPASDSAITAVGGTTLAFGMRTTNVFVSVPHERVWGWDYLTSACSANSNLDPLGCFNFLFGSGGGVSVIFPRPSYQEGVHTMEKSEANQYFESNIYGNHFLPGNFTGRNVPDISFNADSNTGYIVYWTFNGQSVYPRLGGTVVSTAQYSAVAALLGQYTQKKRSGLLNYPIYNLLRTEKAYDSHNAPLNRIAFGNNWFYHGTPGYNRGAGVGTMNVANFAAYLKNYFESS